MIDDFNDEDNIDIFNANFECDDEKQIIDLYNFEKTIVNNDNLSKKIQIEKYNHPLFLNYNYCLFCLERRKTKYSHNNLNNLHNKANIKTIDEFLEKRKINLKIPQNKLEKLAKRRFVHSCESLKKKNIEVNEYFESDTDLYIEKEEEDTQFSKLISKKLRMTKTFSKNLNRTNTKRAKSKKDLKKSSKQLSPNIEIDDDDDDFFDDNKNRKKSTKDINFIKRQITKSYNPKINKALSRKDVLFKPQFKRQKSRNSEIEDTILHLDKNNENSESKKKDKSFSIFGFITNYFYNNKENDVGNSFIEEANETEDLSLKYFEKNEKCGICFEEIQDKFTLHCGDFFCRECIIILIEESLKNITLFDRIECPRCHDPINESQIKFLLNEESLEKYNKMKTKIEGLKNRDNVPCPFPDCEGFAPKDKEINDTLQCQKGHIFCNKCFEIINKKYRLEPKNKHKCIDKYEKTNHFLSSNKNFRKCPKCNTWVKRDDGGCNYFRCCNIWCKFEFCWICGKKYEPSHYRNPLSMCFGLAGSDIQGKMIKSYRIRRIRCILIALLLILILLPIICIFFSFFLIGSFIMYFQFDGKEVRNVRFHNKSAHKAFYIFYVLFIIFISLGLIPFGYICLVLLIFAIPILIIVSKIRKKKGDDF